MTSRDKARIMAAIAIQRWRAGEEDVARALVDSAIEAWRESRNAPKQ